MHKKFRIRFGVSCSDNRKFKIPTLKWLALCALLLAVSFTAQAQPKKNARVGFLVPGTPASYSARIDAFRQSLRELGYVEGQNIVIEYRYAEGKFDRLPELASELVRLAVDVIVTGDTPAVQAVKNATSTIPVVMGNVADPVTVGLISSLARPGGNITGLTTLAPDLDGKRLELFKEISSKVARVAFIWDPGNSAMRTRFNEVQGAARALEIILQSLEVRRAGERFRGGDSGTAGRSHGAKHNRLGPWKTTRRLRIKKPAAADL